MFCFLKGLDKYLEDADRLREENYIVKVKLDEVWLELKKEGEWVIWGMIRIIKKEVRVIGIWGMVRIRKNGVRVMWSIWLELKKTGWELCEVWLE